MITTRKLCNGLSAVLQIPKIERYAARLVRDGLLPHAHEPVDDHEAAILLISVLGTADPAQATWTVERLAGLPRTKVVKSGGFFEWWFQATDAEQTFFGPTFVDLIRDMLGCLAEDDTDVRAGLITVARDHDGVVVRVDSCGGSYRVTFGVSDGHPPGLRTSASISENEMKALADLLRPDGPDAPFHTTERPMLSLVIN